MKPLHTTPKFGDAKPKGLRHTDLVRGSAGEASPGFLGLLPFTQQDGLMAVLTTVQLPIPWEAFGLPSPLQTPSTCLVDGTPAWAWDTTDVPDLGIPVAPATTGSSIDGWDLDHVVLLVPDIESSIADLHNALGTPRLRANVKGRPAAFYRVGPLLEVIESPVRSPALYGIALVTTDSLETTVLNWRSRGLDVGDPQPAIQPGRRIFTVKGTEAGLAVMSPDGPKI